MKPDATTKLIQAVAEYHAVFGDPLPFKVVTARFHRRLNLDEALDDLQAKGIIRLYLNRQGGKALTLCHLDYSNSKALKRYSLIPHQKPSKHTAPYLTKALLPTKG